MVTLGHLRETLGHLNIRSPLGSFRQFFSISNHKANTTELHPKVRKTCLNSKEEDYLACFVKYYRQVIWDLGGAYIGVAGSFSEGGQPFCPAKIQSFPSNIFSCQGGQVRRFRSAVQSYSAKLFCQWVNMVGEWLQASQKWKKSSKIWQKR